MSSQSQRNSRRSNRRSSRFQRHRQPAEIPAGHMIVGRILGAHGLRGEVKIESHTDFAERFAVGREVLVGQELALARIATSRPHKNAFLVRFQEVADRTEAEALRNQWLYIPDEAAMELDEDSFWVHDIIGLAVQTEEQRLLGEISDVLFTGANEVYVVTPAPGINQGKDLLIPALADVVQTVDLTEKLVTVRLLPGLLNEETV